MWYENFERKMSLKKKGDYIIIYIGNWRIAKYQQFSDVYSLRIELLGES